MRLLYKGKHGEWINGVPARDLEAHEVQAIANEWGLSLAQTEGLLIQRGLYALDTPKTDSTIETLVSLREDSPSATKKRKKEV